MNRAIVKPGLLVAGLLLMLLAVMPPGGEHTYANAHLQSTPAPKFATPEPEEIAPAPAQTSQGATVVVVPPTATISELVPGAIDTPGTPLPPEEPTGTPTGPITITLTPTSPLTPTATPPGGILPPTETPTTSTAPSPTTPRIRIDDGDDNGGGGGGGDDDPDDGDVSIIKRVDPAVATSGDTIEFVITVNNDDGRSDDVIVIDTLDESFQIIDATTTWGEVDIVDNTVTVTIGPIFEEDEVVIRIVVTVDCEVGEDERGANQLENVRSNSVSVSTTSDGDDPDNNESMVEVICQVPLTATPSSSPTTSPTATSTPVPTITGTPIPAALPATGPGSDGVGWSRLLLLLVGLAMVTLGFALRVQRER